MSDDNNLKKNFIKKKVAEDSNCYDKLKFDNFRCFAKEASPNIAKKATIVLVPFLTTYFYESGFSAMMNIKNKCENSLKLEGDSRVALSKTK